MKPTLFPGKINVFFVETVWVSAFALGLIGGFREILESQTKTLASGTPAERAMVRLGDPSLADYLAERYPGLRSVGRQTAADSAETDRGTPGTKETRGSW